MLDTQKYKLRKNDEKECFELLETDAIVDDGVKEDALIADIYSWEDFVKMIDEIIGQSEEIDVKKDKKFNNWVQIRHVLRDEQRRRAEKLLQEMEGT